MRTLALLVAIAAGAAGCGGEIAVDWGLPKASGSMSFSQVTGTSPFAHTFIPTHGAIHIDTGPGPSWGGQARAKLEGLVRYIQDLQFQFEGAPTAGSTFTLGGAGGNTLVFSDLVNENHVLNSFTAMGGTVHIDSVVGSTYTCTLTNVQMLGPSGGTSVLNGTVTIDFTFGT